MTQRLLQILWLVLLLLVACSPPAITTPPSGASAASRLTPTHLPTSTPEMNPVLANAVLFTRYDRQRDQHDLQLVNPENGQLLSQYPPIELSRNVAHAFSRDGRRLAIVGYNFRGCGPSEICDGTFYNVDLSTWQTVTTTLQINDYVHAISFHPNAQQVAFVYGRQDQQTLVRMDMQQTEVIAQRSVPLQANQLEWTPDATSLLLYGPALQPVGFITDQPSQRVLKVRASDLQTTWEAKLADVQDGIWCIEHCTAGDGSAVLTEWHAAKVFTDDKRYLLVVHPDSDTLTIVDWTAQQVKTEVVRGAQGWAEQVLALTASKVVAKNIGKGGGKSVVLAPDGVQLYVTQYTQRPADSPYKPPIREYGPLQVVNWQTRTIMVHPELRFQGMQSLPDETPLYWFLSTQEQGAQVVEVRDARDLALKQTVTLDNHDGLLVTRRLNGQPILLVMNNNEESTTFKVLDLLTFAPLHTWDVQGYAEWFVP